MEVKMEYRESDDKYIKLEEIAKEAGLTSKSIIYHYIKKGLLPKPYSRPTKDHRGAEAVYPKKYIKLIKEIRDRLEGTHSLDKVKKDMEDEIPEGKKEEIITVQANKLAELAKEGKYDSEEYKQAVDFFNTTTQSPLAVYFHTLEDEE